MEPRRDAPAERMRARRGLVDGLLAGLCLAAAATWARALTWEPYAPVTAPHDAAALALAAGAGFALLFALRSRVRALGALDAALLVTAIAALLWHEALREVAEGRWFWLNRGLFAAAVALFLRRAMGDRPAWLRLDAYVALVAVALAASLTRAAAAPWATAVVPAAAFLGALLGVRERPRGLTLGLAAALAGLVLPLGARALAPVPSAFAAPASSPGARSGGTSVVLIVLDNLRRDHLSLYGHPRNTSPHIDAWAQGALVFDNAVSTAGWTLPSHASMFTGLHVRSHGAHGYRGGKPDNNALPLRGEVRTLAEIARDAGVATGAVVANHHLLGREFGVDQGFDDYRVLRPVAGVRFGALDRAILRFDRYAYTAIDWPYHRAPFVTDLAIDWLRQHDGVQRFLFVNYMDVHRPNDQPGDEVVPWEDEIVIPGYYPQVNVVLEHKPLDPRIVRSLRNSYDREMRFLDREVHRLLRFLEESGQAEHTLVILTSDHGEYFGEHDLINHMMHVYGEVTNVPLMLRGPGIGPGRTDALVQLVDVFPTALAALGVPVPPESQGQSLLAPEMRPALAEWHASADGHLLDPKYGGRFERDVVGFQDGSLRLIRYQDGQAELYDLANDPRELVDLASARPHDVARLGAGLDAFLASHPAAPAPDPDTARPAEAPVSEEVKRQLRAIGYLR